MPDNAARVRRMAGADLEAVVDTHLRSFPNFFLTFLGRGFLRLLYEALARDPEAIVVVAEVDGAVQGFAAGVERQAGFYSRLIETRRWAFAREAAAALLRRPGIAPRLLRALRRPSEAGAAAAEACLMSIAVRPDAGGGGLGVRLMGEFSRELKARGARAFCLTTDRDGNERVNSFYRKGGGRLSRSFVTAEGRAMNEYVFDLEE